MRASCQRQRRTQNDLSTKRAKKPAPEAVEPEEDVKVAMSGKEQDIDKLKSAANVCRLSVCRLSVCRLSVCRLSSRLYGGVSVQRAAGSRRLLVG